MSDQNFNYGTWDTSKPKVEGYSHELISPDSKNIMDQTNLEELQAVEFPGIDTMYAALYKNVETIPDKPFLGTRVGNEYQWLSWKEVADLSSNFSYGMRSLNLVPEVEGEGKMWRFLGIKSKNRKEWYICELGAVHQNVAIVGFYDTLGVEASLYMFDQTELTTMALSAYVVDKLANMKRDDSAKDQLMKRVTNLIVFESDFKTNESYKTSLQNAESAGFTVYCLDEVIEAGRNAIPADKEHVKPKGEDVYMLGYTSGTTGNPKGVEVRHNSPFGTAIATNVRFGSQRWTQEDSYISFLPSSHIFEQMLFIQAIISGSKIGFYSGDPTKLFGDMAILKPTFFASVPRIYNKIFGAIQAKFAAETGFRA